MQRVGFVVLPGFQMLSVSALSVFELANLEIGEPAYDLHLLSRAQVSASGFAAIAAGRRDVHRRVRPGRSWLTRRPSSDHALVTRG